MPLGSSRRSVGVRAATKRRSTHVEQPRTTPSGGVGRHHAAERAESGRNAARSCEHARLAGGREHVVGGVERRRQRPVRSGRLRTPPRARARHRAATGRPARPSAPAGPHRAGSPPDRRRGARDRPAPARIARPPPARLSAASGSSSRLARSTVASPPAHHTGRRWAGRRAACRRQCRRAPAPPSAWRGGPPGTRRCPRAA